MDAAIVSIHGRRAGTLERISEDLDFRFEFDSGYVELAYRPILGQLFVDRMPEPIETSGLPCWFSHLLPQGASRRLLQRWAGLDADEDDSFDLLVAIGSDLPGAVTMEPALPSLFGPGGYAVRRAAPPGAPGFSLPGAQHKISIRVGERGLVMPVGGEAGEHIAKFHDPVYPGLPRLEWATTEWARAAGIRTHTARLAKAAEFVDLPPDLPLGEGDVFLAHRFDRVGSQRIHVEDFGQIVDLPPGPSQYQSSYEAVARVVRGLCPDDARELVERFTFMVVCGNGDAHLKNWGVVYADHRNARLGPAYDLVATITRVRDEDLALSLAGSRDFRGVTLGSFCGIARALELPESEVIGWVCDAVRRCRAAWSDASARFSEQERKMIEAHFAAVPLCSE